MGNISKKEEINNAKIYKFQKILTLQLLSVVVTSGAKHLKEKIGDIKKEQIYNTKIYKSQINVRDGVVISGARNWK